VTDCTVFTVFFLDHVYCRWCSSTLPIDISTNSLLIADPSIERVLSNTQPIYRLTVGWMSVEYRSSVGWASVEYRSSNGWLIDQILNRCLTNIWPMLDWHSTDTWRILKQHSTDCWSIYWFIVSVNTAYSKHDPSFLYHAVENTAKQDTGKSSHCIFNGITPNLPLVRCAYVILIVLASVFSRAWYKIVVQGFEW